METVKYDDLDLSGAQWRTASGSEGSESGCVEVAKVNGLYAVRDTSNPEAGVLVYDQDEWDAFKAGVQAGEFD